MTMGQTNSTAESLQQGAFRSLQQDAFQSLQHGASLKGLLKPFKGKGELIQFADQCQTLRAGLKDLAHGVVDQAKRHPFSLLPVRLIEQSTTVGTTFLRWQHISSRRMGVAVWADMIRASKTPESMLLDLYEMELQRILLNMQMSLMHSIAKQAAECAEKMAQAEATYHARLQQHTNPSHKHQGERT